MQQQNYYNEHDQLENIQQMDMSFASTRSSNTSLTMDSPTPSSSASSLSNTSSIRRKNAWSSPSIGVNLRVTGQCSQGGRKYMEDYFSVAYQQSENAKDLEYAFIGIYDGHGGAEAAVFAKEHLMMEIINQKLFWSDSDQDVLRAIREGYISTHYAMWREQAKWPKTANGLPSTAGTTATIAFIRREKIYIGHVGDSGIVLGYQNENENFWRSKQLTTDHKPESAREKDRIKRSGGKVVIKSGVPRVVWNRPRNVNHTGPVRQNTPVDEIPFLAVARSLGDLWSYNSVKNEFIVSPDPDVKVIRINPKTFRCLIFGTDGLWNVLSPQEAVDCVYEKETLNERLHMKSDNSMNGLSWTNPSKFLVETALKTWSSKKMRADNTSVVTVILYPSPNSDLCNNYSRKDIGNLYIHTDYPNFNDVIPYQDIAQRYFPPIEYQNLNLENDEIEIISLEKEINPFFSKSSNSCVTYWENINSSRTNNIQEKHEWQSRISNTIYNDDSVSVQEDAQKIETENINELIGEEDRSLSMKSDTCINYLEYPSDNCISIDSGLSDNSNGEGIFMKSFAESYNSLLTEQITNCSTSSSSKIYKSLSHKEMNDILQEQQLYQQECMSEEEGYSLTKLETRREQQRCNNVQTFKILQKNQINTPTTSNINIAELEETSTSSNYWNLNYQDTAAFSGYESNQEQEKPFELNSLLQQERAEEQQVELERFEMQRRMNANDARSTIAPLVNSECTGSVNENQTFTEGSFVEEYLEEDIPMEDEAVQINEISSSVADSIESECIEHILDSSLESRSQSDNESLMMEKIEKIEIMHDTPRKNSKKVKSQYIKLPLIGNIPSTISNSYKKYQKSTPSSVARKHFFNVPNENDRGSVSSNYRLNKYPLQLTSSSTSYSSRMSVTNNSERRQLRSNSVVLDFTKRTLRTRNTLSKDLKAKASLISGIKRSFSVSSSLMYNNISNKPQKDSAKCHKIIGINNLNAERECKKSECANLPIISAANSNLTRLINLRSRQIPQLSSKSSNNAIQLNAKNTRAVKFGTNSSQSSLSQNERRSLRNLAQKVSSKEGISNFSKSTNLQSSIGTFAVQSRSPKIINGRSAVAPTTRTRTLIKTSESDHTKTSIATITAIYGGNKRPNLRSSSISVSTSTSAPVIYRLTRSRSSRKIQEM